MATADLEQQWRELRETYRQMTEEELCPVAEDAFDLTPIAREALQSVIAEKGLKIQLAEAPPREERKGVGDFEDELDLTMIWQVKSEADARLAKGVLDANHIASCLGPDNIADLENFKGSFDDWVDVKVLPEDALRARRLLSQCAPDRMILLPEDEDEVDYAVTCPKCQSQDIILEGTDAQPDYDSPYRPESNSRWRKVRWTCAACGHQWQDEGISHIVNNSARGDSNSSA
jgi:hypothetical protein